MNSECLSSLEITGCLFFPENQNFLIKTNVPCLPCLGVLDFSCLRCGQPPPSALQHSPVHTGQKRGCWSRPVWALKQSLWLFLSHHFKPSIICPTLVWICLSLLSTKPIYVLLSSLQRGWHQFRINSILYKSRIDFKMKHTCRARFLFNVLHFASFDLENRN